MWLCSCGMPNFGNVETCVNNWHYKDCHQVSANTLDYRQIQDASRELRIEIKDMTPNEELFANYYNRGKLLVADMDDTQLREHRMQLAEVATKAKASLVAADDEIRDRAAKKKTKDKEWLVSVDTSQSTSDAINAVKTRAARMSKMDKLRDQLLNAGIDEATVKEMVRNLERKATEKTVKTVTFSKPSTETAAIQVETKKEAIPEAERKPFNPSSLKFGS